MRRRLALCLVLLSSSLVAALVAAQPAGDRAATAEQKAIKPPSPDVEIRTSLVDSRGNPLAIEQSVNTGERVMLVIDVLTSTWFSGAPDYEHLKIPGAVAVTRSEFVSNLSELIKGKTYSGLRREFAIFPQRSGQMVIPGLKISVSPIAEAGGTSVVRSQVRSEPKLLRVASLADVPSRQAAPLVAESVDMQQTLTQPNDRWQVGDILERQVTIRAEGTLGMLIPALSWPPVQGLRQQSLPAQVSDNMARGAFTGKRTEIRRYTLQQAGHVTLPPLVLDWWDGETWQQASLAGQELEVAATTVAASPSSLGLAKRLKNWLFSPLLWITAAIVALALAAFGWGLWWARQPGHDCSSQSLWRHWSQRESVAFRRLCRRLRSGQAQPIVEAFYHWRQIGRLELGASEIMDEDFEQLWGEIYPLAAQQARLNPTQQTALQAQLKTLRRRWRGDAGHQLRSVPLFPLNPSAPGPS